MKLSPRAALCAALTLTSLTGAALVARAAAAPKPVERTIENTFWPTPESDERVHRVALRQETIVDLLNEEITFEAAVERFWDLSTRDEDTLASLRSTIPGESDEDKVIAQVLMFAKVHVGNSERYAARFASIQLEAASFRMKPYDVN